MISSHSQLETHDPVSLLLFWSCLWFTHACRLLFILPLVSTNPVRFTARLFVYHADTLRLYTTVCFVSFVFALPYEIANTVKWILSPHYGPSLQSYTYLFVFSYHLHIQGRSAILAVGHYLAVRVSSHPSFA